MQAMLLSKIWLDEQGTFEEAQKAAQQGENVLQVESSVKFQDIFTAALSKPFLFLDLFHSLKLIMIIVK